MTKEYFCSKCFYKTSSSLECKNKYGECICDLRRWSYSHNDWPIAKLVGVATYSQLLDVGPGLFEVFPETRTDGNTASSISNITCSSKENSVWPTPENRIGGTFREDLSPTPPNLVSTILSDGNLSVPELKRLLIRAALHYFPDGPREKMRFEKRDYVFCVDPRIEPLIGSSYSYKYPEFSLGEIFVCFIFITLVVASLLGMFVKKNYSLSCNFAGGCPFSPLIPK